MTPGRRTFLLAAGLLCGAAVIRPLTALAEGEIDTITGIISPDVDNLIHADSTITDADLGLKFCPQCKAEGLKSIVTPGGCWSTLMNCGNGYYDEDGHYHSPDRCNIMSCSYTCSNGHEWSEDTSSY